jgi:hypothetical protein
MNIRDPVSAFLDLLVSCCCYYDQPWIMWSILYTLLFTITNDELSALFSGTSRTRTGKRNAQGVKIVHL